MGDDTKNKRIGFAELLDRKSKSQRIEDFQRKVKAQKKPLYWVHPVGYVRGFWTSRPEKYAPTKPGARVKMRKKRKEAKGE